MQSLVGVLAQNPGPSWPPDPDRQELQEVHRHLDLPNGPDILEAFYFEKQSSTYTRDA